MPIVNYISADSKSYVRHAKKEFRACLGVSLAFENVKSFERRYYKFFEELKDEFNINNPRLVFKSYDLKTVFPYEKYPEIVRRFVNEVISDDVLVNVVFSSFNTQKISRVRYLKKEMHIMDFLRRYLPQYYAYIPVWKTLQSTEWFGMNVYLDNFDPKEVTNAWKYIKENQCSKVYVVPKGDQCNPLISSADIILEYLDYIMEKEKIRLDVKEIQHLLTNLGISKSFVKHVGSKDIPEIIPRSDDKIPKPEDFIHPIVYVIPERIIDKEKDWIEKSPIYQYLLWFAWKVNGGLKFISSDQDFKLVDRKDYLVYLGEIGKNKARYLSEVLNLVMPDNVVGLDDITEMQKNQKVY